MRALRMNMKMSSPGARDSRSPVQVKRLVKDNGLQRVFEDGAGRKMQIRLLVEAIEPKGLRSLIKVNIKREHRSGSSTLEFSNLLREKKVGNEESTNTRDADVTSRRLLLVQNARRPEMERPERGQDCTGGTKEETGRRG
jgi:hypothetical protein